MTCENTSAARIAAICAAQKACFRSGATLGERFRRTMLRRLDQALPLAEGLVEASEHRSAEPIAERRAAAEAGFLGGAYRGDTRRGGVFTGHGSR